MNRQLLAMIAIVLAATLVAGVFVLRNIPSALDPMPVETTAAPDTSTLANTVTATSSDANTIAAENTLVIEVAGEGANGEVRIELLPEIAPKHVSRIKRLARDGAYDGVMFHRVIDGFMAQTGDVQFGHFEAGSQSRAGTGGSDLPDLTAEFSDEPYLKGVVGMARSQSPNSANSQFFIMFGEGRFLDGNYTVVGRVISGLEVIDNIKRGHPRTGAVDGAPDYMHHVHVLSDG